MSYTFENLYVGCEGGFQKTVTESDVLLFSAVSGDMNPLHINKVYAEKTAFRERIAHGMLSAGFVSSAVASTFPGALYLSQTIEFIRPVHIGDTINVIVRCKEIGLKRRITIETICENQNGDLIVRGEGAIQLPKLDSSMKLKPWQKEYAELCVEGQRFDNVVQRVTSFHSDCTITEAYEIQSYVIARMREEGRVVKGYKVGLTNQNEQRKFGISQPIYGGLLIDKFLSNKAEFSAQRFEAPVLETEIVFIINQNIETPLYSFSEAADYVYKCLLAFDIADGRLSPDGVSAADLIADNVRSRSLVYGQEIDNRDLVINLDKEELILNKDGRVIHKALGSEILGHPLRSLIWLTNTLLQQGRKLHKGDLVITGSVAAGIEISIDSNYEAVSSNIGNVSVSFIKESK